MLIHAGRGDQFKMQKVCDKVVDRNPWQLEYVPNHFKAQEMRNKAVDDCPWMLGAAPDHLKARGCARRWWIDNYTC